MRDTQGGVTTLGRDANHNVVSMTDPAQHTLTTFRNDALGRLVEVRDPLNRLMKARYDERDHLIEMVLPAISAQGAQQALPAARVRQHYDASDLLREVVAIDGAKTRYSYDSAHRLVAVQTPGNPVPTRLEYDARSNLVKLTNSNSQATTFAFDRLNRTTATRYPGGDGETFAYDANSNLVAWNRGAFTVHYTFDELDRLTALNSPATADHIALTYDTLDRVASMSDNSGTTTYGYTDNYLLERVSRETGLLTYAYDAGDRLIALNADGDTTQYRYDDRDRLIFSSLDGQSVSYAYDQADRPTLMSLSNGVTCQQTFHERDGLIAKTYLRGGSPLFTLKHAYNALGQRI